MKIAVLIAAVIGFLVPFVWTILAFILFNAPQSIWADLFWSAVHITCPFWDLSGSAEGMILMPFFNAVLYGFLAYAFVAVRRFMIDKRRRESAHS